VYDCPATSLVRARRELIEVLQVGRWGKLKEIAKIYAKNLSLQAEVHASKIMHRKHEAAMDNIVNSKEEIRSAGQEMSRLEAEIENLQGELSALRAMGRDLENQDRRACTEIWALKAKICQAEAGQAAVVDGRGASKNA
jgi:predicted  nucleic acid-binding Zn-ribbon protein